MPARRRQSVAMPTSINTHGAALRQGVEGVLTSNWLDGRQRHIFAVWAGFAGCESRPIGRPEVIMRYSTSQLALCVAITSLATVSQAAAQGPAADAGRWVVPRTAEGHPDLQGNWTNMSLTPFEREEGRGPVFMREEVEGMERQPGVCPAKPGTIECGRVDNRADESLTNERRLSGAEYNEVYWDRGSRVAIVNGQHRTSFITHPTNGRVPPPPCVAGGVRGR